MESASSGGSPQALDNVNCRVPSSSPLHQTFREVASIAWMLCHIAHVQLTVNPLLTSLAPSWLNTFETRSGSTLQWKTVAASQWYGGTISRRLFLPQTFGMEAGTQE